MEFKEHLTKRIKKSIDKQFSQLKELYQKMKESIQIKLKELYNMLASHNSRIAHIENCMDELEDKIQARNNKEVNKKTRENIGRKCKVLNKQRQEI